MCCTNPDAICINAKTQELASSSCRDVKLIFVPPLQSFLGDTRERALFGETGKSNIAAAAFCLIVQSLHACWKLNYDMKRIKYDKL